MLSTALLVLCSATVALCSAGRSNVGFLTNLSQTNETVDVEYFSTEAGLGITVCSSTEHLLIKSSSGKILVNFKTPLYKDNHDLDQLVVISGRPFLDHRRTKASSYSITVEDADELMAAAELEQEDQDEMTEKVAGVVNQVVENAINKNYEFHKQALRIAVTDLLNDPHTPVIIDAAITMGEKEGIIGHDYPPVLPFYNMARLLGSRLENSESQEHGKNSLSCSPALAKFFGSYSLAKTQDEKGTTCYPYIVCNSKRPCYKTCPPCKNDKCFGMCGKGCTCWKWVCKDCCWHKGCCIHDGCCVQHGFFSMACFNVLSITCKSFNCPLI